MLDHKSNSSARIRRAASLPRSPISPIGPTQDGQPASQPHPSINCAAASVAPADATLQHLEKAPQGDIRLYSEGHFDIYDGAAFEQLVSDQIQFLSHHVPVAGSSTLESTT